MAVRAVSERSPVSSLVRWCLHHRRLVVAGWVGSVVVLAMLAIGFGSGFKDSTDLPDSESAHAYALLAGSAPATDTETDTETGRIVWKSSDGQVDSEQVRDEVTAMLD